MATFNKFNSTAENIAEGVIDCTLDDKYVCLTNVAPSLTNTVYTDLTEIDAGNGYTTGGNKADLTSSSRTGATYILVHADPATWTATGSPMAAFRYAVLYQNSGTKPLIGYWSYGASITLAVGETFAVDFSATSGVLQIV